MSIRNLDAIFRPKSVALIGASPRPQSVGWVIAENLLAGGFTGPIMPVNPKHPAIGGVLAYPDVKSLPVAPDLAVICTPPKTVPGLIEELGQRGVKGAVVITAGFKELGSAEGRALEAAILQAARPHLMRIIGPNCVGILSTPSGLNASFAHVKPRPGKVAFVTQSGAMATTVLDWATARGIGFSHVVSLGDMTDVDFGDMLDYLANDPETTAVLLYIEAVTQARKFMSAARAASRLKPVIAIKAGRHATAARAAASHTGALAGMDAVYDAAFRRAGVLRVQNLEELFDAVQTLSMPLSLNGEKLAILTNGGGVGVLATDALADAGGPLADLSPATLTRLNGVLPPTWSHGNPVDIIGDATGKRYADALAALLDAPEVDAVLVLNCPTAIASGVEAAQAVVDVTLAKRRAVMTSWLGSGAALDARRLFSNAAIPTYDTPDEAIRGFMHVVHRRRNQETLLQVPASVATDFAPDPEAARRIVEGGLAAGRKWLNERELGELLACYRIPTARSVIAADAEAAAKHAEGFGVPVALKIFSPDITHKSDVGGVALDLLGPKAVRKAADAMRQRVAAANPSARIEGFIVQEMIRRPQAYELIIGMVNDPQFGPVLLFGHGGTAVEVVQDKALALPPLNIPLAEDLISRTRIFRQLQGYRDRPAVALSEVALTLVKISQLVADLDGIAELDINPLLADANGVIAVDARVRIEAQPATIGRGQRFAISPYPKELERKVTVRDLGDATIRPVRPEDASAFLRLFDALTPDDVRFRFFAPLRSLAPGQLARFTQIDYDREMAFVLEAPENGRREVLSVVRLAADPDNRQAEFAALVRSDLKGRGIGFMMMKHLIDYARRRGLEEIYGDIRDDNDRMIQLVRDLGFVLTYPAQSTAVMRATLALNSPTAAAAN